MRLGYFTMPMHPQERSPTDTLQEDREAIIFADKLGFHDAFVGEHLTEKTENITNSMLFLATLISDTKTIKLATGTSNRQLRAMADADAAQRRRARIGGAGGLHRRAGVLRKRAWPLRHRQPLSACRRDWQAAGRAVTPRPLARGTVTGHRAG